MFKLSNLKSPFVCTFLRNVNPKHAFSRVIEFWKGFLTACVYLWIIWSETVIIDMLNITTSNKTATGSPKGRLICTQIYQVHLQCLLHLLHYRRVRNLFKNCQGIVILDNKWVWWTAGKSLVKISLKIFSKNTISKKCTLLLIQNFELVPCVYINVVTAVAS